LNSQVGQIFLSRSEYLKDFRK